MLDLNQFGKRTADSKQTSVSHEPHVNSLDAGVVFQTHRKKDVIAGIERLPTLPHVLNEVIRLSNDPDASISDFVSLFSNEQSLTARMLRIVNSPFYGLRRPVTTIPKAIVILGHKTLKSLVFASFASNLFKKGLEEYGFTDNGLWIHSMTVAALARHLGGKWMKLSSDVCDELFVVGLVHDIGMLVIGKELGKYHDEVQHFVANHDTSDVAEMERTVVGIDHCEVGEMIMLRWHIGENMAKAMNQHHVYNGQAEENRIFNATLVLADLLCDEMKVGIVDDYRWINDIDDSLTDFLGLYGDQLDRIREEADSIFQETKQMADEML